MYGNEVLLCHVGLLLSVGCDSWTNILLSRHTIKLNDAIHVFKF